MDGIYAGIQLGEIPALGDIPRNIRTIQPSPSEPSLGQNLPPLTQLLSSAGLQGDSAAPEAQPSQSWPRTASCTEEVG